MNKFFTDVFLPFCNLSSRRACLRTVGGFCFVSDYIVNIYECMALDKFENRAAEVSQTTVQAEKLSDHQLIEAAKAGDEDAFGEIMTRYRSQITNYLYRFLNDYEEAVDLAQETFVRVYFALERYHTDYAFSTYVYRIATNLAISEIRKRKRRRLVSLTGLFQFDNQPEAVDFEPPDEKALPLENLIESEQSRTITRAIATLPEKYRAPLVLRDVEGKSYDDVAAILDLGLGTTKSRISRARKLLRDKLEHHF